MKSGTRNALIISVILFLSTTSVIALFGEGHIWVDISSNNNQISCDKCHPNIKEEFDNMSLGSPHKNQSCYYCHRSDSNITYASGDGNGSTLGKEAHAASIPNCTMCHVIDVGNIAHLNETHAPLYNKSSSNEACILCHTGFGKNITYNRPLYVEYDVVSVNGSYEVQNFSQVSVNSTLVEVKPNGHKHTWVKKEDLSCMGCHSDVKASLENGGHVPRSGSTQGQMAAYGHQGRRHDFDRGSVTIDSCKACHLANTSDFHINYDHEDHAQLDYHAATTEHCYNCHDYSASVMYCAGLGCHTKLQSGDHSEIVSSMASEGLCLYEIDKVCLGCHAGSPSSAESFGDKHFEVYTEPNTSIDVT
ncbi:MAG: hypothetical protein SVJ22_01385 [Halobacteriota archaeon]|nr:hypothetical protein [Halobacteriota archaeon]